MELLFDVRGSILIGYGWVDSEDVVLELSPHAKGTLLFLTHPDCTLHAHRVELRDAGLVVDGGNETLRAMSERSAALGRRLVLQFPDGRRVEVPTRRADPPPPAPRWRAGHRAGRPRPSAARAAAAPTVEVEP